MYYCLLTVKLKCISFSDNSYQYRSDESKAKTRIKTRRDNQKH